MKIKQKVVFMTDSGTIDNLINKYFDLPERFEMGPAEEASNYSAKIFEVDGKYSEKRIADLVAGDTMYMTRDALCNLCSRGIIERGTYVIDMSW